MEELAHLCAPGTMTLRAPRTGRESPKLPPFGERTWLHKNCELLKWREEVAIAGPNAEVEQREHDLQPVSAECLLSSCERETERRAEGRLRKGRRQGERDRGGPKQEGKQEADAELIKKPGCTLAD